jgi:hypothetical protein
MIGEEFHPAQIKFFRDANPETVEKRFAAWSVSLGPGAQISDVTFLQSASPQELIVLCQYRRKRGVDDDAEEARYAVDVTT